MKSLTQKIILSLILASSFALVNCQKPSNRSVKATGNTANKTDVATYPPCNEKSVDLINARTKIIEDIQKIIKVSEQNELDAALKTELQKLAGDLKTVSEKLVKEIKDIKQGATQPVACNVVDPKNPTKKTSHVILKINDEDKKLAKKIAELLAQPNPEPTVEKK